MPATLRTLFLPKSALDGRCTPDNSVIHTSFLTKQTSDADFRVPSRASGKSAPVTSAHLTGSFGKKRRRTASALDIFVIRK